MLMFNDAIVADDILTIQKYLMKKHGIVQIKCLDSLKNVYLCNDVCWLRHIKICFNE